MNTRRMMMQSVGGGGGVNPFQDASIALSLRDLGIGATNVVRVRRDSDNTEQDFTATEITDGTLTSFCGAGNGFVSIWYDQLGVNDASNSVTTDQPKIVEAGSLILDNGKPTIKFENVSYLDTGLSFTVQSVYFVANAISGILLGQQNDSLPPYIAFGSASGLIAGETLTYVPVPNNFLATDTPLLNNQHLFNINKINNEILLDSNLTNIISATSRQDTFNLLRIGGRSALGSASYVGNLQELTIFETNKSAERPGIETNMNNFYNIY